MKTMVLTAITCLVFGGSAFANEFRAEQTRILDEISAEVEQHKNDVVKMNVLERKKECVLLAVDMEGLKEAFVGGIPDDGAMFKPEVERCDAEGLDIKFHGCPLRDAWMEMGLPEEEVATICRIAARIDNGTFEGAGFEFTADTWQPGDDGCCYLHIRPAK